MAKFEGLSAKLKIRVSPTWSLYWSI